MKREVVDRFQQKFDELNARSIEIATADTKGKARRIFDDILIDAYIEGVAGASYILGAEAKINNELVKKAITKSYDGVSIQKRLTEHYELGRVGEINTLLDSEYHRVYTQAQFDVAREAGAKKKTWYAIMDDKTRETHAFLNGITIPIEDEFITFDGDSALAPGGFSKAQNNANCRCILDFTE